MLHKFRIVYIKYMCVVTIQLSSTLLKFMSALWRVCLSANLHFNTLFGIPAYWHFTMFILYNDTDSLHSSYSLLCIEICRCMRINNASMCMNMTRGSQYIVMQNTGATDLEISEQIEIMKVDDVLNISHEYFYIYKHFR